MDRKDARAAAKAAIEGLGTFALVRGGAPDTFGGMSPVALVTSRSLQLTDIARSLYEITNQITVSIYVARQKNEEEATEDLLDDLALSVVLALHETGLFFAEQSDAGAAGAPNRNVDQTIYRVERIPFTVLDEGSDM